MDVGTLDGAFVRTRGQWFHASLPGRGESSFFVTPGLTAEALAQFECAVQVTGARGQVREGEFTQSLCSFAWRSHERVSPWFHAVVHVEFRPRDFAGRPGSVTGHGLAFDVEESRLGMFDPFVLWRAELDREDRERLGRVHWLARCPEVLSLDPNQTAPDLPGGPFPRRPWLAGRAARLAQRLNGNVAPLAFERLLTAWLVALLPNQPPVLLVVDPNALDVLPLIEALHVAIPEPERPLASFTTWRLDVPRDPAAAHYPFRFTVLPLDRHVEDHVLSRKDVREHYRVFLWTARDVEPLRELQGPAMAPEVRDAALSYARLVTPSFFPRRGVAPAHTLQRVQGWARRVLRDRARFDERQGPYCRGPLARFVRLHELDRSSHEHDAIPNSDAASRSAAMARSMLALSPSRAMGFYVRAIWGRLREEDWERAITWFVEAAHGAERASCLERPVFPIPGESAEPREFGDLVAAIGAHLPTAVALQLVRRSCADVSEDAPLSPAVRILLDRLFPLGGSARARIYARALEDAVVATEVLGRGELPGFHAIDRRHVVCSGGRDLRSIDRQVGEAAARFLVDDPERAACCFDRFREDVVSARSSDGRDPQAFEDWKRMLRWYEAVPEAPGRARTVVELLRESGLDEASLVRLAKATPTFPFDDAGPTTEYEELATTCIAIVADERKDPHLLQIVLERYAATQRASEGSAASWRTFLEVVTPRLRLVPEERARRMLAADVARGLDRSNAWITWLQGVATLEFEDLRETLDVLGQARFDIALEDVCKAEASQGVSKAIAGGMRHLLRHEACRPRALRAVAKLCRDDPESGVFATALEEIGDRYGDHEATLRRIGSLAHLFDARRLTAGRFLAAVTAMEDLDAVGFDAARRLDLYTPPERIGRAVLESRQGPRSLERILADLDDVQVGEAEKTRFDLVALLFTTCLRSGTARRRLLPVLARTLGNDLDEIVSRCSASKQDPARFADVLTRGLRWIRADELQLDTWVAHLSRALVRIVERDESAFERAAWACRVLGNARRRPELHRALAGSIDVVRDVILAIEDERRREAFLPELADAAILAGRPEDVWDLFRAALPDERRMRARDLDASMDHALRRLRIPELLERHPGFGERFLEAALRAEESLPERILERLFWLDLERTDGRCPGTLAFLNEVRHERVSEGRLHAVFESLALRHPLRALHFYLALPEDVRGARTLRKILRSQWDVVRGLQPPRVVELAVLLEMYGHEARHHEVLIERVEELQAEPDGSWRRQVACERLRCGMARLACTSVDERVRWRASRLAFLLCEEPDDYLDLVERLVDLPWDDEHRGELIEALVREPVFDRVAELPDDEACTFTQRALRAFVEAPTWLREAWLERLWSRLPVGRSPIPWAREEIARLTRESPDFAGRLLSRGAFAKDPERTRQLLEWLGEEPA